MKPRLRDCLIIAANTVLLFTFCELGLRLFGNEATPPEVIAYQPNGDYLVSLTPGLVTTFKREKSNGGQTIQWETNSLSFRGKELKHYTDLRLMVYGDSNIQGSFSALEDTFAFRLEQYLSDRTQKDVEVVNAGIAGFGPDQSLIRLSKEVGTYRPDIVVLHIFADNDFGDLIRNRLFELDDDGNLVRTKFTIERDQLFVDAEQADRKEPNVISYLSSLAIVRTAQEVLTTLHGPKVKPKPSASDKISSNMSTTEEEFRIYKEGGPRQFSHFDDRYDIDVATHPNAESSRTKVRLMHKILRQFKQLADEQQIELLVLIQPSAEDLTENRTVTYKHLQSKYPEYRRDRLSRAVEAICIGEGIASINLFDVFVNNSPEQLYFRDGDNHWNDAGQDHAARVTAAYVAETLLPSRRIPRH